jgi:hypothetical protein
MCHVYRSLYYLVCVFSLYDQISCSFSPVFHSCVWCRSEMPLYLRKSYGLSSYFGVPTSLDFGVFISGNVEFHLNVPCQTP